MVRGMNLFMVIFGSPHQKSASKAPMFMPLLAQVDVFWCPEHLLPAGTFRKDPEPCSSCVSSEIGAGNEYSNLGWKPTDLCLPEGDSLLTELTF